MNRRIVPARKASCHGSAGITDRRNRATRFTPDSRFSVSTAAASSTHRLPILLMYLYHSGLACCIYSNGCGSERADRSLRMLRPLIHREQQLRYSSGWTYRLLFWFQLGSNEGPKNRHFFGISGADSTVLRFANGRMPFTRPE